LVIPYKDIPTPAKNKIIQAENGRIILAYGEATGHHHSLALSSRVTMFLDDGGNGSTPITYLKIEKDLVPLEHQEHSALTIEPGDYKVIIQQTFQASMSSSVQD
jgi:hypothetical protein